MKYNETLNLINQLKLLKESANLTTSITFKNINFKTLPKEVAKLVIELDTQTGNLILYSMDSDNNQVFSGPNGSIGKIEKSMIDDLYNEKITEQFVIDNTLKQLRAVIKKENIKISIPILFQTHDSEKLSKLI